MLTKVLKQLSSQSIGHTDVHVAAELLTEHLVGVVLLLLLIILVVVLIIGRGMLVDGATHRDLPL